jgi:hypothetical protein
MIKWAKLNGSILLSSQEETDSARCFGTPVAQGMMTFLFVMKISRTN